MGTAVAMEMIEALARLEKKMDIVLIILVILCGTMMVAVSLIMIANASHSGPYFYAVYIALALGVIVTFSGLMEYRQYRRNHTGFWKRLY